MPGIQERNLLADRLFRERQRDKISGGFMIALGTLTLGLVGWKVAPAAPFLIDNPGVIGAGAAAYGVGTLLNDQLRRSNDEIFTGETKKMSKPVMIRGTAAIAGGLLVMLLTGNKGHVAPEEHSRESSRVIARPRLSPTTTAPAVPPASDTTTTTENSIETKDGRRLVWYLPGEAKQYGDCKDINNHRVEPDQTVLGIMQSELGGRGYTPDELQKLIDEGKIFTNEPAVSLNDIRNADNISIVCPP